MVVAVVVLVAELRPSSSTATTVWVRLCASIPRMTWPVAFHSVEEVTGTGRWAHLSGGDATLLSSHAGRPDRAAGRKTGPGHRGHGVVERARSAATSLAAGKTTITLTEWCTSSRWPIGTTNGRATSQQECRTSGRAFGRTFPRGQGRRW